MFQSGEAEIIVLTQYNPPAYDHIRGQELYRPQRLDRLRVTGGPAGDVAGARTVPPFPAGAAILLSAWWPVAPDGVTAMPVWDPEFNPPLAGGNGYATWRRAVAVDPRPEAKEDAVPVAFLGQTFPDARRIPLARFRHIRVDGAQAAGLMGDPQARKAAAIALGRPLQAGDYLVLAGLHAAVKPSDRWVWATLWWHDRPERGPHALGRPAATPAPWGNYLLEVAVDAKSPAAADGSPNVTFNPWLEARFPDRGAGGGVVSNCIACHSRASYPAVAFLPVRRGDPDLAGDPAYAPNRLRTDFVWSIPRRAIGPAAGSRPMSP
jgi:hypothetical protein